MNDACPICEDPSACRGYPHLWRRLREDPEKYRPVHDLRNGVESDVERARRLIAEEYPPGTRIIDRPCGSCP